VKKYNKTNRIKNKTKKMEEEFLTRLINADDDLEEDTNNWGDDSEDDADEDLDDDDADDVPAEEEE
jgi:hypothetical protein